MKRPGKILIHETCKAYSTVNADRLPKYNQHRVITDGHSGIPKMISPADEVRIKSFNVRVDETEVQGKQLINPPSKGQKHGKSPIIAKASPRGDYQIACEPRIQHESWCRSSLYELCD